MWSLYQAARSDVVGQCRQSIEALLPLFYGKAAPSDMIQRGLELVRTTRECLHLQKSHYLSYTKHFETLIYIGITISETFGKDTSVFDIGRPSYLDGLACGPVTLGDLLLEDIANQDLLGHTLRSLFFFPGLSRQGGSPV